MGVVYSIGIGIRRFQFLHESTVAVLDVHFFKKKNVGMLKDFLSYEISKPDDIKQTGVNGT